MNNDLISRKALKKAIENYLEKRQDVIIWETDMFNMLDNAPTVDFEKLGESLRCQIRAEYGSCDDCELSCPRNELIKLLGLARPQGEWARHDEWVGGEYIGGFYHVNCPCEDGYYSKWETNFCPNCGLPMQKGGAE